MDYDKLIAPAAKAMRPSGIRKFFDLAAEMPECISLGVGEPDFKTPWAVREAGIESLEHGRTRYTSNAGLKELRAEISRYLERRMNLRHNTRSGKLNGNPDERLLVLKGWWRRMPLYVRPFLYFFYRYFLRLGFLDGKQGFVFHFLQAFWFRLVVDVKIEEHRHKQT